MLRRLERARQPTDLADDRRRRSPPHWRRARVWRNAPRRPVTRVRNVATPLCASATSIIVGSPTIASAGRGVSRPKRAIEIGRPQTGRLLVVTEQNVDRALRAAPRGIRGPSPARRRRIPSCRKRRARKAGRRLSRSANGSPLQAWPSTGTTSVWPERTTPPSTCGPMVAISAALSPAALGAAGPRRQARRNRPAT